MIPPTCEWFATCARPAAGAAAHPVLEYVPICQTCADRLGLTIVEVEWI